LAPCAGCKPQSMLRKHGAELLSRTPCSVFHTDRPSSAKYSILSAEEEKLALLGACLRPIMSGDMGDRHLMIALASGAARTRPKPTSNVYR
jgi:hypothetical protein